MGAQWWCSRHLAGIRAHGRPIRWWWRCHCCHCVDALEDWLVALLRGRGFEFVEVSYAEAKNLGVNLVALGNNRVLSMRGAKDLNARMRAMGFDVFDPDMSMFTLGGGGVHCLCQALCREEV